MRPYGEWVAYVIAAMICKDIKRRYLIDLTVDAQAFERITTAANGARLEFNSSHKNTLVIVRLPLLFPHNNGLIHYSIDIYDDEVNRMIVNSILGMMP